MNWYYVEGGQQAGPVDDLQLQELVRSGRITNETLIWRDGMPNWLPYREVAGGGVATAAAPAAAAYVGPEQAQCAECRGVFYKQDMIQYGTVHVCANCKPVFLQKLSEGVQVQGRSGQRSLPVDADALLREIDERDYRIDIGSCISRGWQLVKANFWLSVGATFLIMICMQAAGIVPILGAIASLILQGPLMGGLYYFFIRMMRGETVGVGDAFSGFSIGFWRLCGTMLLMVIMIYLPLIPGGIFLFVSLQGSGDPSAISLILLGIGVLGAMYLGVGFSFAMPLSADMRLGVWDALRVSFKVVSRHWFAVFGLLFVCGLLAALGLIACIIGIFVTLPIFYAATMYAYEDIFGVK